MKYAMQSSLFIAHDTFPDSASVVISVDQTVVNENAGTIEVCLSLRDVNGSCNPFTAEIAVDEEASNATVGTDFQLGTLVPNGCPLANSSEVSDSVTVEFLSGKNSTCGSLTILDDSLFEAEESFVLTVQNATLDIGSATITITIARDQQGMMCRNSKLLSD